MPTLNVSLSEPLQKYIEEQVASGSFRSASDYVAALIRRDQERRGLSDLEAELLKGIQSGPATEMTSRDWEDIRRELHERIARREQQ